MRTVIVLPTYNEKENIAILVPKLENIFKAIKKHEMHILVVDDESPDGTADEVRKFQKIYKNVHLITEEKKGLGVAYLLGFQYALQNLNAEVLISMDADLSHPAELIPKFMDFIDEGYDLVIGSRYIKRGNTPDWSFNRKLISRCGNMFVRIIGGLYKIHDCTSGFRAFKVSVFNQIDIRNLHTRGYAFLSTFLHELVAVGSKVKEIPLVFHDRKFGQTKLKTKDMVEFFFNAFRLRFRSLERAISFTLIGASGVLVNLGLFMMFKKIFYFYFSPSDLVLLYASLIGDELSIIYNFFLNSLLTFKNSLQFKKLAIFHYMALIGVVIGNIVLFALYKGFGVDAVYSKLAGIFSSFLFNYLLNSRWTMRD